MKANITNLRSRIDNCKINDKFDLKKVGEVKGTYISVKLRQLSYLLFASISNKTAQNALAALYQRF